MYKQIRDRLGKTERIVFAMAAICVLGAWVGSQLAASNAWVRFFDNLHWTVAYAAATTLAGLSWWRSEGADRSARAWFTLAFLSYSIGQVLWDIQVFVGWNPFPGPSDVFFVMLGPLIGAGFHGMLRTSLSPRALAAASLDILMVSLVALCITLALYLPRVQGQSLPTTMLLVAYPVALTTAFGAGLCAMLALRLVPTFGNLLLLGMTLFNALLWAIWNYLTLTNSLSDGTILNYVFSINALASALGICLWSTRASTSTAWLRVCSDVQRVLPLALAMIGAIAIAIGRRTMPAAQDYADLGVIVIIVIALLGQGLLLYERDRLLEAERKLQESETRLRAIFNQTYQFMGILDVDGTLVDANETALSFAGVRREEVVGRPFPETPWWTHSGEEQEKIKKAIRQTASGETVRAETTHIDSNGRLREVEFTLSPARDDAGKIVYLIPEGRDVTERRSIENQLRQSQKLEAIGQLAGGVAHDFNNLLTVIIGYSDMLLSQKEPMPNEARMPIEGIRDAADRAAFVTRQLLLFSRQNMRNARDLDLNQLLQNCERLLRRLLPETIQFEVSCDPGLAGIEADAGQIEQIIVNLAINARDAMEGGGLLRIETRNMVLDDAYCEAHPGCVPGRYVLLAVCDSGCGMAPEVREHIFEPFFTTKPVGKGTGLGLATVYGCVTQNAGHVSVYSEPGVGSTFNVFLPAKAPPPSNADTQRERPAPINGTETILLVEDEEGVRRIAVMALRRAGYTVLEAMDGEEALRVASGHADAIHLLITDLVMPVMSGRELAKEFAATRPTAKVLFMSGYTDDVVVRQGILAAETAFIQKPFTVVALGQKVREVLDDGAASSQIVAHLDS